MFNKQLCAFNGSEEKKADFLRRNEQNGLDFCQSYEKIHGLPEWLWWVQDTCHRYIPRGRKASIARNAERFQESVLAVIPVGADVNVQLPFFLKALLMGFDQKLPVYQDGNPMRATLNTALSYLILWENGQKPNVGRWSTLHGIASSRALSKGANEPFDVEMLWVVRFIALVAGGNATEELQLEIDDTVVLRDEFLETGYKPCVKAFAVQKAIEHMMKAVKYCDPCEKHHFTQNLEHHLGTLLKNAPVAASA